jgi:cysteate synthase
MASAWQAASPSLLPLDERTAREQVKGVYAKVLSNRKPPYAIKGGVYDALCSTCGFTYTVDNAAAMEAGSCFAEMEGCDLHSAAAVALAGLRQAVGEKRIGKGETVLLNITGGGLKKIEDDGKKIPLEADFIFNKNDLCATTIMDKLDDLLKVRSK